MTIFGLITTLTLDLSVSKSNLFISVQNAPKLKIWSNSRKWGLRDRVQKLVVCDDAHLNSLKTNWLQQFAREDIKMYYNLHSSLLLC